MTLQSFLLTNNRISATFYANTAQLVCLCFLKILRKLCSMHRMWKGAFQGLFFQVLFRID